MLGQGVNQKIICASMACTTSGIGVEMASDKDQTRRMLQEAFVPVPEGT
jgi:cyanophycin synthetase